MRGCLSERLGDYSGLFELHSQSTVYERVVEAFNQVDGQNLGDWGSAEVVFCHHRPPALRFDLLFEESQEV